MEPLVGFAPAPDRKGAEQVTTLLRPQISLTHVKDTMLLCLSYSGIKNARYFNRAAGTLYTAARLTHRAGPMLLRGIAMDSSATVPRKHKSRKAVSRSLRLLMIVL